MSAELRRVYRPTTARTRPRYVDVDDFVERRLADYRRIYRRRLLSHLPVREPREHLYDLIGDYPRRGGKGLRPSLCLAACGALGGDREAAVGPAITFELLHNAFLIHDDIEDESHLRRGLPTLHEQHGVALAINAGDALTAIAMRAVRDAERHLGGRLTLLLLADLDHLLVETVEGQAMELGWRVDNRSDITETDYLRMILKKTCWYTTIHPLRFGAMAAGWSRDRADRLVDLGLNLGSLFQINDDILNVSGDEAVYGKEIGGDILEGKRTLLLIHFLRTLDAGEHATVQLFLKTPRPERDPDVARWIQVQMHERGSVDAARQCAAGFRARAERATHEAFGRLPATDDRDFLLHLPGFLYGSAR